MFLALICDLTTLFWVPGQITILILSMRTLIASAQFTVYSFDQGCKLAMPRVSKHRSQHLRTLLQDDDCSRRLDDCATQDKTKNDMDIASISLQPPRPHKSSRERVTVPPKRGVSRHRVRVGVRNYRNASREVTRLPIVVHNHTEETSQWFASSAVHSVDHDNTADKDRRHEVPNYDDHL